MLSFYRSRLIPVLGLVVAGCSAGSLQNVRNLEMDTDTPSVDGCGVNGIFNSALAEIRTAGNFYFDNALGLETNWYGLSTADVRVLEDYQEIYWAKLSWIAAYVNENVDSKDMLCTSKTNFTALVNDHTGLFDRNHGLEKQKQWSINTTVSANRLTCVATMDTAPLSVRGQAGSVFAEIEVCYDPTSSNRYFQLEFLNQDGLEVDASSAFN